MAELSAAQKMGKRGGRQKSISEKKQAIVEALYSGASKAAICCAFNVKRTTLYDALKSLTHSDGLHKNPMADLVSS